MISCNKIDVRDNFEALSERSPSPISVKMYINIMVIIPDLQHSALLIYY